MANAETPTEPGSSAALTAAGHDAVGDDEAGFGAMGEWVHGQTILSIDYDSNWRTGMLLRNLVSNVLCECCHSVAVTRRHCCACT